MYCGYARLCVCVSVCLSAAVRPHYCTDPDVIVVITLHVVVVVILVSHSLATILCDLLCSF